MGKKVALFIATDNMDIRNRTVYHFKSRTDRGGGVDDALPVFHISEDQIKFDSDKISAMVDQLFLMEMDDLIVTSVCFLCYSNSSYPFPITYYLLFIIYYLLSLIYIY